MPRQQERQHWNETAVPQFANAARLMHTQNVAVQNATRMTGQVCHYAMSVNRAWFNLWSTMLMDYAALPRRITSAQVDFMGDVLKGFEETGQEMGGLVLHAEEEAEEAMQDTAEDAGRTIDEVKQAPEQMASAAQRATQPRRRTAERRQRAH